MYGCASFPGGFNAAAILVEPVGDGGFGAVFVGSSDGRWEGIGVREVRLGDIVGPVWAAVID